MVHRWWLVSVALVVCVCEVTPGSVCVSLRLVNVLVIGGGSVCVSVNAGDCVYVF